MVSPSFTADKANEDAIEKAPDLKIESDGAVMVA